MTVHKLTPTQKDALQLDGVTMVTAGAGTGKTMVLTRRYMEIMESFKTQKKGGIGNILVLTFTEKAAGEMKERIYDSMEQKGDASFWRKNRDAFSDCHISTFHSFYTWILRQYPLEAGVDPLFGISQGFDQRLLLRETVEKELNYRARTNDKDLAALLAIWNRRQLVEIMGNLVYRRYNLSQWLSKNKDVRTEECLQRWFGDPKESWWDLLRELKEEIKGFTAFKNLEVDPGDKGFAFIRDQGQLYENRLQRVEPSPWATAVLLGEILPAYLDSRGRYKSFKHFSHVGSKKNWQGYEDEYEQFKKKAVSIRDLLASAMPAQAAQSLPTVADLELARVVPPLARLLQNCIARYQEEKKRKQVLDFEDLEWSALQLVLKSERVRSELQKRFLHIMVDEFQDTNQRQWQLVKTLAQARDKGRPDRLFMVGDAKQSIYSFRGGDVKVFTRAYRELKDLPGFRRLELVDNFRSAPALITFYNCFFAGLLGDTDLEDYEAPYGVLTPGVKKEGKVEALFLVGAADRLQEAHLVARKVEDVLAELDGLPAVAILLRRMTNVRIYEEALKEKGIPFATVRGKGFYQQQEVYDLYNLLAFLDDPRRDLELAGVLRSPFIGCTDEELHFLRCGKGGLWQQLQQKESQAGERLWEWLQLKSYLPVASLLERVMADSGFFASLAWGVRAQQKRRNVEKVVELARDFDSTGRGCGEFIEFLAGQINQGIDEGEAPAEIDTHAVIMSIHQAKGLQFPAVIMPDLEARFHLGLNEQVYLSELEGNHELAFNVIHPERGEVVKPALRKMLAENMRREQLAEEKRLFYVGATRTEEQLFLVGSWDGKGTEGGKDLYELSSFGAWLRAVCGIKECLCPAGEVVKVMGDMQVHLLNADDLEEPPARRQGEQDYAFLTAIDPTELKGPAIKAVEWRQHLELSPTALSLYGECPKRYSLRHLYSLRADMVSAEDRLASSMIDSVRFGRLFHMLVEAGIYEPGDPRLDGVLHQERIPKQQISRYRDRLKQHIANLDRAGWREFFEVAEKCYSELPFRILLYTDKKAKIFLRGIMDRVIKRDGKWYVIDFKTTALQGRLPAEVTRNHGYDLQVQCYLLAMEELVGSNVEVQAGVLYTETGVLDPVTNDEKSKKNIRQKVASIQAKVFPPKPGEHCNFCEYCSLCHQCIHRKEE